MNKCIVSSCTLVIAILGVPVKEARQIRLVWRRLAVLVRGALDGPSWTKRFTLMWLNQSCCIKTTKLQTSEYGHILHDFMVFSLFGFVLMISTKLFISI